MKRTLTTLALALGVLSAAPARAEFIELDDGRMIHGEILAGPTSDDGLAVRLFDTGGVLVVGWDHLPEERAKELRIKYGIDVPVDEVVEVDGHVVTLTSGQQVVGVALNFAEYQSGAQTTLQVKTANGVQGYDSGAVGKVLATRVEALVAYTVDELYTMERDRAPPDTAAAHFQLADYCSRIGDHEHAKLHYEQAKRDAAFLETPDGKSLEARLRRCDILIRAKGAQDLVIRIKAAMRQKQAKSWNDALRLLFELDEKYKDPQIREAIRFDTFSAQVTRERDKYFRDRIQAKVVQVMSDLVDAKAREKKPLRKDDDSSPALQGTLAGAKTWAVRELPKELWAKAMADFGLDQEEFDSFWRDRSSRKNLTESYGTGSFIVMKKATLPGSERQRRPAPGSRAPGSSGGAPAAQASKPKSDEEFWDGLKNDLRGRWLRAFVVEHSNIFNVIRTDESELCSACAGKGFTTSTGANGQDSNQFCPICNGGGKTRKVVYR